MGRSNSNQPGNLLLYSLISFRDIIEPILTLSRPGSVCEIGVEKGLFTDFLIKYCTASNCRYTGIDPSIEKDVMEKLPGEHVVFLKDRSIDALRTLERHDIYFIDGDHNYYTVTNELLLILKHPDRAPLIFLHDVGWPWGRRDQYCSPENIPTRYRRPSSSERGVAPGEENLQPEAGFRGAESDYGYAAAVKEGGPCNGVLTAVEDAIEETESDCKLIVVPAIFGLGILYFPHACGPELLQYLRRLSDSMSLLGNLMQQMETNRIDLFLQYLKHNKQLVAKHDIYKSTESAYNDLLNQYHDLLQKYQELHGAYKDLFSAYEDLRAYCVHLEDR